MTLFLFGVLSPFSSSTCWNEKVEQNHFHEIQIYKLELAKQVTQKCQSNGKQSIKRRPLWHMSGLSMSGISVVSKTCPVVSEMDSIDPADSVTPPQESLCLIIDVGRLAGSDPSPIDLGGIDSTTSCK